MKSFAAQLKDFESFSERKLRQIHQQAAQKVVEAAQTTVARGGRMPVDTGNLRNSLVSGLNGSFGQPSEVSYVLTIANFDLGDVAQFAWSAEYALPRHFKGPDFGQGGGMWVDYAAAQWQQSVDEAAR